MPKSLSPQEFSRMSLQEIKKGNIVNQIHSEEDIEKDREIYNLLAKKKWDQAEQRTLQHLQAKPYDVFMRNFLTYIQIKKKKYDIAEELIEGTELLDDKDLKCKTYGLYIKFLLGQEEEVTRKRKEIDAILQTPQSENVPNSLLYAPEILFLKDFDATRKKKDQDLEIMY